MCVKWQCTRTLLDHFTHLRITNRELRSIFSLHLKEEARDFLEPETIKDLVRKYSQFINFNIYLWTSKTETVEEPIEEEAEEKKDEKADEEKKDEEKKEDEKKEDEKKRG